MASCINKPSASGNTERYSRHLNFPGLSQMTLPTPQVEAATAQVQRQKQELPVEIPTSNSLNQPVNE